MRIEDNQVVNQIAQQITAAKLPLNLIFNDLYDEIKKLCHAVRKGIGVQDGTLGTTGTVHEAYIKISQSNPDVEYSAEHLLNLSAQVVRQVVYDYGRMIYAHKRGREFNILSLDSLSVEDANLLISEYNLVELLEFDQLLDYLTSTDPRMASVILLRVFGGLSNDECGAALGISVATVKRDWSMARAMFFTKQTISG